MRVIITLCALVCASSAAAHPGHWGEVAGHDHWLAGAAIGIAIIIGLAGAAKGRKKGDAPEASDEDEAEEQPA
ncbi:DUF6732 family protein [Yoonia sp. 208BN28-4]|uniref:DUF6732 family protein n=1 Tax=Yoonia sp. 208BN28-4 TaxID=3126505 RepID=UPI0030B7436E